MCFTCHGHLRYFSHSLVLCPFLKWTFGGFLYPVRCTFEQMAGFYLRFYELWRTSLAVSSGRSRAPNTYVLTFRSPLWLCTETSEGACEEKHVLCLLCILGWLCCPGRKGKAPLPYSASLVNNTDDIRDGTSRYEPSYNAAICVVLLNPQNCPPKYHCHFRAMKLRPVGGKRLVRVHAGGKGGTSLRLGVSAPFPHIAASPTCDYFIVNCVHLQGRDSPQHQLSIHCCAQCSYFMVSKTTTTKQLNPVWVELLPLIFLKTLGRIEALIIRC